MASDGSGRKLFAGAGLAALRQGAKELGAATKAFPDSISIDEPGTMFAPTQGEIAQQNREGSIWGRVQEGRERAEAADREPVQEMDRDG